MSRQNVPLAGSWACLSVVAVRLDIVACTLVRALCAYRTHCAPVVRTVGLRDIDWPCRDILSPCLGQLCRYRKSLAWPTLSRHEMFCRDKTTSALGLNSIAIEPCLAVCCDKDFSIATGLCRAPRCHRRVVARAVCESCRLLPVVSSLLDLDQTCRDTKNTLSRHRA